MERKVVLAMLLGLFTSASFGDESVTIIDVAGSKSTGIIKAWTPDKLLLTSSSDREYLRSDLRSVLFDHPTQQAGRRTPTIWLTNGDLISARAVTVADDLLTISWPVLGESELQKVPLEGVAAIIFEWPVDSAERLRFVTDLQTLPPGNDLVMLANGDRSLGEFKQLDAAHVELKVAANTLRLDRSRVRAIRFNPELTATQRPVDRRAILTIADGSQLTVTSIEMHDETLQVKSSGLGELALPVSAVRVCHMYGDKLIPISDYEPAQVEFTPYLSAAWQLVRNANVRRGPLSLRGIEFVTGLGMHSRTVVTYPLKGHEREFQAIVGIDDISGGEGSVSFGVELDGRRVWTSPEITGRSAPYSLPPIDLRGSKQLTLLVEYGEFADVGDYADWCDAVLIADPVR